MSEPNINEKVRDAIAELMTPLPSPVTHGQFNKRMFLESFVAKAGAGVSIEADDIMEHGALTDREFKAILKEYLDEGIIVKESNLFGAKMYKLNLTT
jgi:hypothetical protein